ncbi:hypothetical protein EOE67_10335 [Rheinheimera riviphila]|uniref:Uncharacterized protein n=1 Tax=Rheinheimera riviphila TaxID=1834037 RepID=A0A437QSS9_9GAMM|nr:hypothetical protein [Rheinheimera riviphila]RVU37573.1 hypothetical protein EOE67_10335 [Rheinheimera riviphila]
MTIFKTPGRESKRALLPLLLSSCLLHSGTVAIAAEPAHPEPIPNVQLPDVLTMANPDVGSVERHTYQPLPTQTIAMPKISNWQAANSRVKELGGWMFYASEADAAVPEQPSAKPAEHHSKHHHHADKKPKPATAATPVKDQP